MRGQCTSEQGTAERDITAPNGHPAWGSCTGRQAQSEQRTRAASHKRRHCWVATACDSPTRNCSPAPSPARTRAAPPRRLRRRGRRRQHQIHEIVQPYGQPSHDPAAAPAASRTDETQPARTQPAGCWTAAPCIMALRRCRPRDPMDAWLPTWVGVRGGWQQHLLTASADAGRALGVGCCVEHHGHGRVVEGPSERKDEGGGRQRQQRAALRARAQAVVAA
jgi:hypothetical protein